MSASDLEKQIRNEIPALKNVAFHIQQLQDTQISVTAPLSEHLNHKGTGFGGSLYQIALVACYGLFLHLLKQHQCETKNFVIAKGQINYLRPVTADLVAEVQIGAEQVQNFIELLKKSGKADLILKAAIHSTEKNCALFEARFVAFLPRTI